MVGQYPFQQWLDRCSGSDGIGKSHVAGGGGIDEVAARLRTEARLHFESLPSSSSSSSSSSHRPSPAQTMTTTSTSPSPLSGHSTIEQDLNNSSCITPNGSLALLVSTLGPALASSSGGATCGERVRAVHCLVGALEGCAELTHGVRRVVGNFLVELCRPAPCDERGGGDVDGGRENDCDDDGAADRGRTMDYVDAYGMTPEELTDRLRNASSAREMGSGGGRSSSSPSLAARDDARDAAITGLTALLRTRLELFPTQESRQPSSLSKQSPHAQDCPATRALGVVRQSMEYRMELAMSGVRYRCRIDDASNDYGGGINEDDAREGAGAGCHQAVDPPGSNVEDGLSRLPRSKRSMCFDLLDAALDGLIDDKMKCENLITQIQQSPSTMDVSGPGIPPSLLRQMSAFASLSSSCMHGETDPRCLVQLLSLFNKIQRIMMPLFVLDGDVSAVEDTNDTDTTEASKVTFPFMEMFDAVAPYYPVHFTPPRNDPHGITQGTLHDLLLAVLSESGVHHDHKFMSAEANDRNDDGTRETMTLLAARMFLERLEPPRTSDFDPPSNGSDSDVEDKLDAIRDLSYLFLPRPAPSKNERWPLATERHSDLPGQRISPNVTRVPLDFLSELSLTMARVHEDAVSSDEKALASSARKFSSCLVKSLEPASTSGIDTFALWEAYTVDVLRHLTPILGSAPQGMHGRATTAYFASLAAEGGGLMTLNKVLDGCYPRFLDVLSILDENYSAMPLDIGESSQTSKLNSRDEEKLAAAMRGIAALISSSRVTLQKWQRDNFGVQVHPHPLSSFAPSTLHKIALILNESIDVDKAGSLEVAAAVALESVLTSCDLTFLDEENMALLEESISLMARVVLIGEGTMDKDSTNSHEWSLACARVLGSVISVGICKKTDSADVVPSNCERINTLAANLLPKILASATFPHRGLSKMQTIRYDWVVLAGACANGILYVSERIVSDLLLKIITALKLNRENQKISAMALSHIIRHGGPNVGTAFHELSSPGPTAFEVVHELCRQEDTVPRRQLQVGMSMLQLPASRARDEEAANDTIKRAQSILPYLIPVFECPSAITSCGSLAKFVDKILPPLSEPDEVSLYITLPLLDASLKRSRQDSKKLESVTSATLMSMVEELALFSIRSDHHVHSRSSAASCLFSILFKSSEDNDIDVIRVLQKLLREVVFPELSTALRCLARAVNELPTPRAPGGVELPGKSLPSIFSKVDDTLSLMSVLGSASACRGGSFSQFGDKIALFLMELACKGVSQYPFSETTAMQLTTPSQQGQKHPLLNPASLTFLLPASAFGSMLSVHNGEPFWRQRLTHKTIPILLEAINTQVMSQNPPGMGTFCVVCHILCCLPASLVGEANMRQLIPTFVGGLVYFSKNSNAMAQSEMITTKPTNLLSVVLAALVKLLTVSPEDVTKFIAIIIPSLLLLCSTSVKSSEASIPKCLLMFQCLETVASHPHARNSILRERDQVIAVLSMVLDHPSAAVRNAVAQARNVWYTLS